MDAIKCLISRRSIREYTDQPVTERDIEDVVMMSQMASCWENTQPIRYVAVLDQELKDRLAKECTVDFPWNPCGTGAHRALHREGAVGL